MPPTNKKKVLIIGYFWPYVFGGGRIIELVNYFHRFGWDPIILTIPLTQKVSDNDKRFRVEEVSSKGDIFEFWRKVFIKIFKVSPKKSISGQLKEKLGNPNRKSYLDLIFNIYQEILGYPDTEKNWERPAMERAEKIIKEEKIDAIISTYPMISHIVASKLKKKYQIPWIADFPDLWSQNHNYLYGRIRKYFDKNLEIKTLRHADALITVSQLWAEKLKSLHKQPKIFSVPHSFDPAVLNNASDPLSDKFTITYSGRVYAEMYDPEPFFIAVKELIEEKIISTAKLEIRFYGDKELWLRRLAEKYDLLSVIHFYSRLPKNLIIEKQRESQLLLLLNPNSEIIKGYYTLKLYDYLAACRPIIAANGMRGDVVDELLNETGAGFPGRTVEEIKEVLTNFYTEYSQHGRVAYQGIIEKVDKYNYLETTRNFADILNQITKKKTKMN